MLFPWFAKGATYTSKIQNEKESSPPVFSPCHCPLQQYGWKDKQPWSGSCTCLRIWSKCYNYTWSSTTKCNYDRLQATLIKYHNLQWSWWKSLSSINMYECCFVVSKLCWAWSLLRTIERKEIKPFERQNHCWLPALSSCERRKHSCCKSEHISRIILSETPRTYLLSGHGGNMAGSRSWWKFTHEPTTSDSELAACDFCSLAYIESIFQDPENFRIIPCFARSNNICSRRMQR